MDGDRSRNGARGKNSSGKHGAFRLEGKEEFLRPETLVSFTVLASLWHPRCL